MSGLTSSEVDAIKADHRLVHLLPSDRVVEHIATQDAEIAALKADNAAKDKAFAAYVEMYGVQHGDIPGTETECPEDDTCECAHVQALNAAFGPGRPGAALLEVVSLLRQHQHREEPDVLATLKRLLEERGRIAHMVSAEQHRKALVRARNEGLETARMMVANAGFKNLASLIEVAKTPEEP